MQFGANVMELRLNLQLLGTLRIEKDGTPLGAFRSRKAPVLFAYLAYTQTTHQREVLADMLWDARSTKQSLSNLRTILAQLRDTLEDHLVITNQTLAFDTDVPYTLDTQQLLTTLDQTLRVDLDDKLAQSLETALHLYRGDLLQDVVLNNASRFNEWLTTERENIRQQVLQGYQKLTAYHVASQTYASGLLVTGRWLKLDPLNELAHREHMYLLALNQQRTQALRQFKICRDMLAEEFAVEPAQDTHALYEMIRDGSVGTPTHYQVPQPVPHPPQLIQHNLPAELNRFVGQEQLIEVLQEYLQSTDKSLITLTGVGGSGKSRLAIHVTHAQKQHFPDGIIFLDLSDFGSAEDVPLQLAQVMNIDDYDDPFPYILEYIRQRQLLLIFDSFEYVLEASDCIKKLLAHAHHTKILITSRVPLNLYGEHIIAVKPFYVLDVDNLPDDPDELLANDAIKLFVERARERRHDISLTVSQLQSIAQICHLLDGLPLAIELVAARSHLTQPSVLLEQLTGHNHFDYLSQEVANRPPRHRTLRDTFDWSYALLNDTLKQIFPQLGVFAGSFSLDVAIEIINQINEDAFSQEQIVRSIYTLIEHNLVQITQSDSHTVRLHLLDTIRAYARELLQQTDIHTTAFEIHAKYYQQRATQVVIEPKQFTEAKSDWLIELEQDYLNYAQAFESSTVLNEFLYQIGQVDNHRLIDAQELVNEIKGNTINIPDTSDDHPIHISASIEINRPPEVVFDYMIDPEKIPIWATVWKRIEFVTSGEPRLDSIFEYEIRIFGKSFSGEAKIVAFEPDRKKVTQLISHPEMGRTTFLCEPTDNGTLATLRHEATDLSRLVKVIRPIVKLLIKSSLALWLENLKTLLEDPTTST